MSHSTKQILEAGLTDKWESYEPVFSELLKRLLTEQSIPEWLSDWSDISRIFEEAYTQTYIDSTLDTSDEDIRKRYLSMVENLIPKMTRAEQDLKMRLLESGYHRDGIHLMLRDMQNEADLFREENIHLATEITKLTNQYDRITGGVTINWGGERLNMSQISIYLQDQDRAVRERAWNAMKDGWLEIRGQLNTIYLKLLKLRKQKATNAGFDSYLDFRFREMGRFDYTPADCTSFHQAIAEAVVPVTGTILEKIKVGRKLDDIRPWDWLPERGTIVQAEDMPPLKPYQTEDELIQGGINIFNRLDAQLGRHFADMAEHNLLDLESRAGKAMGGYCTRLAQQRKAFIFMNGIGSHDTVQTLLHEAGHAFHDYEGHQPLTWQEQAPLEFCEVASMSMEKLAAPYLEKSAGGFYNEKDAARAFLEHLRTEMLFLPYMATVDAFQHWVYAYDESEGELTADMLDNKWLEMEERFLGAINYGADTEFRKAGWHRKLHIFQIPFYYIEYGMAQVGAMQVWRNSLDQGAEKALADYKTALGYGATKTLPELFEAAGAEFRFDVPMLSGIAEMVQAKIAELEKIVNS
ncbi:MAG: oligoendopeptidase F [Cellvibrionaceae bacterium]|jgi:oligoendopeptidase F